MTAAALLDELNRAGIRLAANGDRLHVEALPGTYTADLRARIVAHKQGIMELLAMRDRLLVIAHAAGVPDKAVTGLPAHELQATIDQLPLWPDADLQRKVMVFYLRSLSGREPCLPGSIMAKRRSERPDPQTLFPNPARSGNRMT